ncbi:hypothetical protein BCD48_16750 [Pseudofrankia sp. BMG5.36]|nr:hypothetical protein BCD48_16750 [Pseudofrankia sp. BMG5.36]
MGRPSASSMTESRRRLGVEPWHVLFDPLFDRRVGGHRGRSPWAGRGTTSQPRVVKRAISPYAASAAKGRIRSRRPSSAPASSTNATLQKPGAT